MRILKEIFKRDKEKFVALANELQIKSEVKEK